MMKTKDDQSLHKHWLIPKINVPWDLKLNSGGRKRPVGKRAFGSRSSSKKGCVNASNCTTYRKNTSLEDNKKQYWITRLTLNCQIQKNVQNHYMTEGSTIFISFKVKTKRSARRRILTAWHRRFGEYCNSLDTKSTASGGMRLWKI